MAFTLSTSKKQPDLGTAPIGGLLLKLGIPSIVAQLTHIAYNMVDRMYVGHIQGYGDVALTGLGIALPVIMLISAFSALVCMGAASRAAIYMGRQDKKMAEKILSNVTALIFYLALILTLILELFGPTILTWFGASAQTLPYAWEYTRIMGLGTIFALLALGLSAFITSQGFALWGLIAISIGAVANIFLDPLFIFTFNMGVAGAAWSTVIAEALSGLFVLWFLISKFSYLHIQKADLKLDWSVLGPCLLLGFSPFLMQVTESAVMVCFNSSLLKYGGDLAVGAMTIVSSINQFILLPLQGITLGAQPILSYNFGAGNKERVDKTFRLLLISSLGYVILAWLVIHFTPELLVMPFTNSPELIEYTSWAMRIYLMGCIFVGIHVPCQNTFVALGDSKDSIFVAFFRKIVVLIPLIYILPLFFSDKVAAVFGAEPIANVVGGLVSGFLFYRYHKTKFPLLIEENKKAIADKSDYLPADLD